MASHSMQNFDYKDEIEFHQKRDLLHVEGVKDEDFIAKTQKKLNATLAKLDNDVSFMDTFSSGEIKDN